MEHPTEKALPTALSLVLREWRRLNDLTQEQAARRADRTLNTWQRWESGTRPDIDGVAVLSGMLGLPVGDVLDLARSRADAEPTPEAA